MPGTEDRVAQPFQSSPETATAGMAFWEAAGDAFSTFFSRNTAAISQAQPADCSAYSRAECEWACLVRKFVVMYIRRFDCDVITKGTYMCCGLIICTVVKHCLL